MPYYRNRVLRLLQTDDLDRLRPHLNLETLKCRQRLQAPNWKIQRVYFLESGIASIVAIGGGERRQAEVGIVGYEGFTGVPVILGAHRSPCDVFMQVEGSALSISADEIHAALNASPTLLRVLLRFVHVASVQANYTALANARGDIPERLARWLLMARDRLEGDEMALTHEFVALMMGVRRAGVTMALHEFERRALIKTSRGSITILDRAGIEELANGLYGVPEAEFGRLFEGTQWPGGHAAPDAC